MGARREGEMLLGWLEPMLWDKWQYWSLCCGINCSIEGWLQRNLSGFILFFLLWHRAASDKFWLSYNVGLQPCGRLVNMVALGHVSFMTGELILFACRNVF